MAIVTIKSRISHAAHSFGDQNAEGGVIVLAVTIKK